MNDLDYARENLTRTDTERLGSAGRHLVWLRERLAAEAESLRALAEAGNTYAAGNRAGFEAALRYLAVLEDVLLAENVVARADSGAA